MRALHCILMRGGTSKGPFFRTRDLPSEVTERDEMLIRLMGAGQELEIDGIGGGNPLSSKVAMVDTSESGEADVDYLFAQVGVINRVIDTAPNCGNMLVGVAPFAIERGLVEAKDPETVVRIRNVNTGALVEATVQTPGGEVTYSGSTAIDGVPGKAAPVKLTFRQAAGSKTGKLFPTGQIREIVRGVEATLIDMSVPVVMMAAEALGKSGAEIPADLDGDREFIARLETIRIEAGHRMGFANAAASVLPKVILVSRALRGGTISGRYFMPHSCHMAFAVTGGICLATASLLGGTVAADVANWAETGGMRTCHIEHPMGQMLVEVELDEVGGVKRTSLVRTARKLFAGKVYIPWNESSAL